MAETPNDVPSGTSGEKFLPISEFRDFGYLHEVNRRVLHPLGLALAVSLREDGSGYLLGVYDARDDLEGFYFDEEALDPEKARRVADELARRAPERISAVGYVVQPVPGDQPIEDRPPE